MNAAPYPHHPGARVAGPSSDAADAIAPQAPRLRDRVLAALTAAGLGGLTADEAAAALGLSVLTVRPRVAELHRLGRVAPTGASGMTATVWCARSSEQGGRSS